MRGLRQQKRRTRAGFTLVELLVSLLIVAIVTSLTLLTFGAQQKSYHAGARAIDIQEDARLTLQLVLADVRMAGFLVPARVAIASRDGGATGSDVLCTSDTTWDETEILEGTGAFERAALTAPVVGGVDLAVVDPNDLDIDDDGDDDFAIGAGIIISEGGANGAHCARITDITGGTIEFDPAAPLGFVAGTASGLATPAFIYEVDTANTSLSRNTQLLSGEIESLQVEFFVDANGNNKIDGTGEFPLHDITALDSADVRNVRVSIISRARLPEPDEQGFGVPAVANLAGAPPDGFKRRLYQSSAQPRNIVN